ncbi:MAG TPA: hypothetical protein GX707_03575 [Epulopiscium sp.]|nr:hypothetical protein [Candidatus Epulonipiscium sp.]
MIEWQFEHFKTFTPYGIMQQAAASLLLYEGENTDGSNSKMGRLTEDLISNTGHPAWMPARDNGNLDINTEGSVFRNKARLFSVFYICVPPDLLKAEGYGKQIMLTGFGRALAEGKVSEAEFYKYIIQKFEYPHLAYSDYDEWKKSGVVIRPLLCIIKTMVELFEKSGKEEAYLTAYEIFKYLQPLRDEDCRTAADGIIAERKAMEHENIANDKLRKINEMLSFLAIAGYVYIDSSEGREDKYRLNLIMRHPLEKTLFYLQRTAGGAGTGTRKMKVNVIDEYKKLWEE